MSKAKKRNLIILLGVLVVVCIAALIVSKIELKKETIEEEGKTILEIDPESVTAFAWDNSGDGLAFHKEDTVWLYDEDEDFPVDEDAVMAFLANFESVGSSFTIDEVEDLGDYGLDNPVCTITFTTDEGEQVIELGDFSNVDSKRYISIGDGKVYLATQDPLDIVSVELSDFIRNDTIPALDDATKLVFEGAQDYSVEYVEDNKDTYCDEDVYFTTASSGEKVALDTELVKDYLTCIENIDLSTYVTYKATDNELADCGLAEPELRVSVTHPDADDEAAEVTTVVSVGRNQKELAQAQKSDEEDALDEVTAYVRVGDSSIIYQITLTEYQNLLACSCDELRHQEIFTADTDDITSLEVELEGTTYSLTSEEKGKERVWSYGQDTDVNTSSLMSALGAITAESFTDEESTGKLEIGLKIGLDDDEHPTMELEFYRYDGSSCLAVLDGKTIAKVSRSSVVDLIEAVNAIVLE